MNRIQLQNRSSVQSQVPEVELEGGLFTAARDSAGPHTLFAPLHYERNYAYPLIIWLHGQGGDECQLRRIMPLISLRNYVAVAPRGTRPGTVSRGFCWDAGEAGMAAATQRVFDSIDAASERFHIASHRVFLAGFECGGTMAFRIALQYPHFFAGALSVGGPFPTDGKPLASIRQARRLPLFIAQGRDSREYSLDRTCSELHLFHAAGLSVTLRQYPCGDELNTQMLHDMDVWIMEQVTGIPAETTTADPGQFDLN
jgi:phospholipase/carboxylesterase